MSNSSASDLSIFFLTSCTGARAFGVAFFGRGIGPILLDDVQCIGNEPRLLLCPLSRIHNCNHFEDAGVRCPARGKVTLTVVY